MNFADWSILLGLKAVFLLPLWSRLEFDAYRADLEELSLGPRDAVAMARIEAAQQQYQLQKDKYERLRSDVTIKLKFLEENKVSEEVGRASSVQRKVFMFRLNSAPCPSLR